MSCSKDDPALEDDSPLGMVCGCGHSNKNHHHPSKVCIVCMQEALGALQATVAQLVSKSKRYDRAASFTDRIGGMP